MILFDEHEKLAPLEEEKTEIKNLEEIEELTGKLDFSHVDKKLMHSVVENDESVINEGKLIRDSLNQGISSFNPSMMFEQLVSNFSLAKQLFGESLLNELTGYDQNYIENNRNIPEFQKALKKAIEEKVQKLKKDGVVDKENRINEKGVELASVVMCVEELENLMPKGVFGEKLHKKASVYGDGEGFGPYRKGARYRDIAIRRTIKTAVKRQHREMQREDIATVERQSKGKCYLVYAIDSSGSMKGNKIDSSKKAGVALAYKALSEKDMVGLIVFGDKISLAINPTDDFTVLLKEITKITASKETNITLALRKSIEMLPQENVTKHLILITDAIPTAGQKPEEETLEAALHAKQHGITISLVGINLDEKGRNLAEKIVEIGEGKLYVVKNLEEIDRIVLEDYYSAV